MSTIPIVENSASLANIQILVIDDNLDILLMLKTALKLYGAVVKIAASGQEAFELLRDWQPNVLLCDLNMPGESGCQFLQRLRSSNTIAKDIPAIAFTAGDGEQARQQAAECGFSTVLRKPIDPATLVPFLKAVANPLCSNLIRPILSDATVSQGISKTTAVF